MRPIAYDKGYLFLRLIDESVGRERWDAFLARYFDRFAFQSMNTARFLEYLRRELLDTTPGVTFESLRVREWVNGPGLPSNAPQPRSDGSHRGASSKCWPMIPAWRRTSPSGAGNRATNS